MEESAFIPDGYCGLYCASCASYLATKKGEAERLPHGENCRGCKSDVVGSWCSQCPLKACARQKGVEFCVQCKGFPCEQLESFKNDPRYPYHSEVYGSMAVFAKHGKARWLMEMKKRWSCPECGREASWWDLSCGECGRALKGYRKPQD
jgi:hypothetical protein